MQDGEIKSCLSGLDPKDKRKAKLETMLTQAKEREKKGKEGHDPAQQGVWQPPPPSNSFGGSGNVLNFLS